MEQMPSYEYKFRNPHHCFLLHRPHLVDINTKLPQILLGHLDLLDDLLVRFRYVVEGQDSPAQADEHVGAEGDDEPEGKLGRARVSQKV
jgi:hypothetical protein